MPVSTIPPRRDRRLITMWTLTYLRTIPRDDLLLRVMGPDRFGKARYYVDTVKYGTVTGVPVTYAGVSILPPGETRTVVRGGQEWLDPDAVVLDDGGVFRLLPLPADA
jgi:hypothetical protein